MANIAIEALNGLKGFLARREASSLRSARQLAKNIPVGPQSLFGNSSQVVNLIKNPPLPFGGSLNFAGKGAGAIEGLLPKLKQLLAKRGIGTPTKLLSEADQLAKNAASAVSNVAPEISSITGEARSVIDDVVESALKFLGKKFPKGSIDESLIKPVVKQLGRDFKLDSNTLQLAEDRLVGVVRDTNAKTIIQELAGKEASLLKKASSPNLSTEVRATAAGDAESVKAVLSDAKKISKAATEKSNLAASNIADAVKNPSLPPVIEGALPKIPLSGRASNLSSKIGRNKEIVKVIAKKAGKKALKNKTKTVLATAGGVLGLNFLLNQFGSTADAVTRQNPLSQDQAINIVKKASPSDLAIQRLDKIIESMIKATNN